MLPLQFFFTPPPPQKKNRERPRATLFQLMSYGGCLILTFNMQFVFNTNKFLSIMAGFLHNFCNNVILIIFHLNF